MSVMGIGDGKVVVGGWRDTSGAWGGPSGQITFYGSTEAQKNAPDKVCSRNKCGNGLTYGGSTSSNGRMWFATHGWQTAETICQKSLPQGQLQHRL